MYKKNELEYTLKFIENVKNSDFVKNNNVETLSSRLDESLVYFEEIDAEVLLSLSN